MKVHSKNYATPLFESKLKSIANIIEDNDIYLILDETMNVKKRCVLNMLVGVLNGNPTIPMLFKISFLEITNAATVMQNVIQALRVIWPENIHFERLKLLVSDQASYMIKAGEIL